MDELEMKPPGSWSKQTGQQYGMAHPAEVEGDYGGKGESMQHRMLNQGELPPETYGERAFASDRVCLAIAEVIHDDEVGRKCSRYASDEESGEEIRYPCNNPAPGL